MSGETQSSSLSGTIYASVIDLGIIAYQYDDLTVTPYFRYKTIENEQSDTARFPRWVKSTGPTSGTPTNETTALGYTEMTTTSATVQVARVGIARELTETAKEDSVVGRALYVQGFIMDAARLYGEYFDTTATALFSSVTEEVGPTGQSLSLATMVAALAANRASKAKGAPVISLHDNQLKQLQQSQLAGQGSMLASFFKPEASNAQFGGYFMNAPIWSSGLNPTSTGDRLGCIWSYSSDEFNAFAYVVKRAPSSLTQTNILMDAQDWASFARTGHGIVANNFAAAIRSINA